MTRKANQAGRDLIKNYEGLRLKSYLCPAGVWTIGWGHTKTARPMQQISLEQAEALFNDDIAEVEAGVERLVTVPLTENHFAALVCFAYNVGIAAFGRSTLLKRLNGGAYDSVPEELLKWTKAGGKISKGLVKRREAEAALWRL